MLVAHSMGSQGGQQNFPFGYIPNELHGIGLPDFMTPGPPPGQPLLSEHDAQHIDSFLNGFDTSGDPNKDGAMSHFQNTIDANHEWMMPPTFVGSETSLRPRHGTEWQQNFPMSDFAFGQNMNMAALNQSPEFHSGMPGHGFPSDGHYDHNLLHQLHNAAQTLQPPFPPGWPPQSFQPQSVPQMQHTSRPTMRFGSDSHFQPSGYAPPDGQYDHHATPNLDWLEERSSAANTQPNTQPNTEPNTQPSSPNWTKKRKLEDYQADNRRNGFNQTMNGQVGRMQPTPPNSASHRTHRTLTNQDQPPTPISRSQLNLKQESESVMDDDDADFDDDDDPDSRSRSTSPAAGWKAKPIRTTAKPAHARKKSTASNTPGKSKAKLRQSSGGASSARTPLTADQKKANHTNSEQRRRDATARAYAELYDLVPELDAMGKQSTMKKLEIVVQKVRKVRDRVHELRAALGFDVETGAPLQHDQLSAVTGNIIGDSLESDMTPWQ